MEELKQKLINDCNESGLPLEAILFVTKDLWRDVEDTLRAMKAQTQQQLEDFNVQKLSEEDENNEGLVEVE